MSIACSCLWPAKGAPLMRARFPRAFLDLNREPYELRSPGCSKDACPPSPIPARSGSPAGSARFRVIVADGQEIYPGKLPVAEALSRIETLYKPYHRALRRLVTASRERFGYAALIDCHSMPSTSLSAEALSQVDIVLGDRYGSSCSPVLTDLVEAALRARGFGVGAQQALCRRFHHRALRRTRNPSPRPADRDQPRPLHAPNPTLTPHAWFDGDPRRDCAAHSVMSSPPRALLRRAARYCGRITPAVNCAAPARRGAVRDGSKKRARPKAAQV